MKLVFLMYLEGERSLVEKMLREVEIGAYSSMPMEGHTPGMRGWLGEVAPYRSELIFTVVSAAKAERLMGAVSSCAACESARHPVRALQVDVERAVVAGGVV